MISLTLLGNAFGQVVQIDPALHFLIKLVLQIRFFIGQLLQFNVIAGVGRDLAVQFGDAGLQGGDVIVDGVKLPLLLEGEA